MDELRDYQLRAVQGLRAEIAAGSRNIILCSPTGSGKTLIGCHLMQEVRRKGKRALFVVDRLSLLDQTSEVLDRYGIDHGIIQGGHWRFRPYEQIQVCSQQTLARREWPQTDLIIVDEAHTVTETVRKRIAAKDVVTIGLTATPFTRGLGKVYESMVNVTTTNRLIEDGFLANYRIFAASEPNMDGVKVVAGEWDEKQTSERAMAVVGDCVAEYLKHGDGRKFICSAVDTTHVEEIHRQFMAAGVQCATYTYKVSDEDRAEIVKEFRKPDSFIRGLITVTAASKGFDVPDIGVVIMARPLRKSLAEHIQFFGRGLRAHPEKSECIVLDHSGNSARFWEEWTAFFEAGASELDDGRPKAKPKKTGDAEDKMMQCPQCKHLHPVRPFCPSCGHEYPRRESVKHLAGTLSELVASGDRRAQTVHLWPQVVAYARSRRGDDMAAGRKLALALFKKMTGNWPASDYERTDPVPITPEVANKIKSMNIAYARARQKEHRMAEAA